MKNMIVIAGPSAVGKTTVSDEIIRQNDKVTLSRSATTRAPRGDAHDSEYVYMTREKFASAIASGDMLEHTEYSGYLYGTPKSEIARAADEGKMPLLILDLAGVASLRESEFRDDTLFVYLYDTLNTLEERLYARYMTPPSVEGLTRFVRRKEQNIADYLGFDKHAGLFDLLLSNAAPVADTAAAIIAAMSETPDFDKESTVAAFREMAEDKLPKR
jgi:guanylate kinase